MIFTSSLTTNYNLVKIIIVPLVTERDVNGKMCAFSWFIFFCNNRHIHSDISKKILYLIQVFIIFYGNSKLYNNSKSAIRKCMNIRKIFSYLWKYQYILPVKRQLFQTIMHFFVTRHQIQVLFFNNSFLFYYSTCQAWDDPFNFNSLFLQ